MRSIVFTIILFCSLGAWSHPVSFKDSVGIMGYHSPMLSHQQVSYSFEHWFAMGVHHFSRPDVDNKTASFVSTNFLLKRWNGASYQGNLYANLGVGESHLLDEDSQTSGYGLLQFDIEDRKYYFLAKTLGLLSKDRTDFRQTVIRAGVAPYQGSYTDIHAWLIVEWQHFEVYNQMELTDTTPFLRVFYKNILFEIGQSMRGITRFNYITHF